MLRRIASGKYAVAVAVVAILVLSVYVSRQDQKTRDQYKQKCAQLNDGMVSPASHREDCDKGADDAARHLPRWYQVFGWPEGITTLAILLTLVVIADQTAQTKRAAIATEEAAKAGRDSAAASLKQANVAMQAERAWIVEKLDCPLEDLPRQSALQGKVIVLGFEIVNHGRQPAIIRNARFRFHSASKFPDEPQYRSILPPDDIGLNGRILVPGEPMYAPVFLESGSLDDDQLNAITGIGRTGQTLNLYIYGRIDYESMGVQGVSQFGYRWDNWDFKLSSDKPGFRRAGLPPAYNFQK